jgi:adenylyltransferase/sulfurtransferase
VPEISVEELDKMRREGKAPFVLDVRRPFEAEVASLGADQLIPVEELENRLGELKVSKDVAFVVHCKAGGRSKRAIKLLRSKGYTGALNLTGGITAWSDRIDQDVPRY